MRIRLIIFLGAAVLAVGCAPRMNPEYFREVKALRPEGYGNTNYGLASGCRPGGCAAAQREYHARFMAIREKYSVPMPPIWSPLLPYAEAVAARVDGGEITSAQAEALIQEMRARLGAESARLDAMQAQADAAYWSAFWQSFNTFQQQQQSLRPLSCTTTYIGRMATTQCY